MIEHLRQVWPFFKDCNRTQFKISSQANNTQSSYCFAKGMHKTIHQLKFLVIAFLFFGFSSVFSSQQLYGQCDTTIFIDGAVNPIPQFCVNDSTEYVLSVPIRPMGSSFFGSGVIDSFTTDSIAIFRPDSAQAGTHTISYSIFDETGTTCANGTTNSISIIVHPVPDAGDDGTAFVCNDGISSINLFTSLNGTPETNGVWDTISGVYPNGSNGTLGPVEIATLGAGVYPYKYTIKGFAPCPDSSATVTLTITEPPVTPTLMPISAICEGESAMITLTGLADATYEIQYEIPDSTNFIKDTITSSSSTVTFSTLPLTLGGTFTLSALRNISVTPSCVNAPISVSETLTVNSAPSIQGRDTALCHQPTFDLRLLIDSLVSGDGTVLGDNFGNYNYGSNSIITPVVGTTTYFVRDSIAASQCVDTTSITLTVTVQPDITGRDTSICNGQSLDLRDLLTGDSVDVLEYGTNYGTYSFSSGSIIPPGPGIMTYYIRDSSDAAGCVDTAQIIVTVTTQPTIQGRDTAICAGQDVDLSTLITRSDDGDSLEFGTVFGTYGPQSDSLQTNITTTTIFYVRDSVGGGSECVDTTAIVVTVSPQPEITGKDTTICAGDTINLARLITRTMAGDSLEYGLAFGVYSEATDSLVAPTINTTYFVRDSTGVAGCSDTTMLTINVIPTPIIQGRDTAICAGQDVDLSTLITRSNNGDSLEFGTVFGTYGPQSDSLQTNLMSTMTFFVRDSLGAQSCADTAKITVTVYNQPEIVGGDTTICAGETINLENLITRTTAGDSLEFGTGFGVYSEAVGPMVTPAGTQTYFVRDSVGTGGCVDTAMIVVTVIPAPFIQGQNISICAGEDVDLSTLLIRVNNGDSLEFGTTYGTFGPQSDSLQTNLMTTTTFYVRDSIGLHGCVDTARIVVTVHPQPDILGRDTTICSGETVDLSTLVTRTVAGDSLEFGTGYGVYSEAIGPMVAPLGTQVYFIRDSVGAGGCVDTTRLTVMVIPTPSIQGRDTAICAGQNVDLSTLITRSNNGDSLEIGTVLGTFGPQSDSLQLAMTTTTVFFIRDSISLHGCADTTMITVTVHPQPAIQGRDTTICSGETVDLSTLVVRTVAGDSLEFGTGFGVYSEAVGPMVSPTGTQIYFIRDSVGAGGCVDTTKLTVTVIPTPSIQGRDTAICAGQNVDLSTLITRSNNGDSLEIGTVLGTFGPQSDSLQLAMTATTVFFIRDSIGLHGCADTTMITVTVHPQPAIQGRDTTICSGGTVDLSSLVMRTVSGDSLEFGTSLGVYSEAVGPMVSPISTQTYFIRDSLGTSGCFDTTMLVINVVPTPNIQGRDSATCAGQMVNLATLVTRNLPGDSLEFGTVYGVYGTPIDGMVAPTDTTTYFIRDSVGMGGCWDTTMVTLFVSPQPNIQGRDTSVCAEEVVDLSTLITGTPANTLVYGSNYGDYLSSNLQNPSTTTTYYVRDSSIVTGCVDTATITINIFTTPIAGPVPGTTNVCIDAQQTLIPNPSSGTLPYMDTVWISDAPATASVDANGTVTGHIAGSTNIRYVIFDANGCQDTSANHLVYVFPRPVAGDILGDTSLCEDATVTVNANPTLGSTPYTLIWSSTYDTVATINAVGVITGVNPGATSIQYIVSDNNGCLDTSNYQVITVDSFPNVGFNISDPDTTICAGDMVTFTGTGGVTYEFLVNNTSVAAPSASNTYQTTTLAHGDMVRVAVTNMTGCQDTSGIILMKVDTIPDATLIADDADNIIATGQPVIFTGAGGSLYTFSVNNVVAQAASAVDTFAINTLNDKDTVMVEVFDGNSCADTATIVVTVNAPPVAVNDTIVISEDALPTNILVQANDSDPEGDIITTTILIPAVNGSSTVINNDSISYMPNPNFNGLDSIEYFVSDTGPNNSPTAKVYITVLSVNDMPMATNDTLRITEDDPVSIIDVQANDVDADGDSLITTIVTMPGKGIATVMMDSTIAYTPMPDSTGVDVIAYQVCDTAGLCGVAIIFIEIDPINDRPVANQDSIAIPEDTTNVAVAILANDFDADRDVITLDTVHNPINGSIVVTNDTVIYTPQLNFSGLDSVQYSICDTALCDTTFLIFNVLPINESPMAVKDSITVLEDTTNVKIAFLANDLEVDGDAIVLDSLFTSSIGITGTLTNDTLCYTPPANFNGLDSIKYIISDGVFKDSTYIIINVLAVNDAPIAVNDTVTVPENSNPAIIAVQANDSDPDGHLFATSLVSGPTNGTATVAGGNINYTPPMSFNGLDTIKYQICDTQVPSACDSAYIFITVSGVNDAPVAVNDTIYLAEDTMAVLIPIESNDFDIDGDATTISILTAATQSLVDSIRNDTLVYQPALNFVGLDSIRYQLFDGALADQGKVYIFISPRNDAPVTMRDSITIQEDASNVQVAITANDNDVDAGDSLIASVVVMPNSGGTASILDDTMLVYTPGLNFNGIDTIVYQVCDTSAVCTQDTVIATVQSINDKPLAIDDYLTVNEDTSNVIIDVQANDSDGDGESFTTVIISSTMTVDTLNGDSIIITPPADFTGVQLIGYKICDTTGLCDTAIVTVTILPINDAPIAVTDQVMISQDTTNVGIAPLANDTDIDDDTLTISGTPMASNGTVTLLGTDSISYTPTAGYSGIDTIDYIVCDTSMACVNGIVVVTVGFVNTPPVAMNDVVPAINEDGGTVMFNVLTNDSDINGTGDSLKVTAITTPIGGTATIVGDSMVSYTPQLNFNGVDSLQYTVCDTSVGCAMAWVYFTVTPVNDAPVAVNDTMNLTRDTMGALVAVEINDSDVDGDATTVTTIGNSTQGVVPTVTNDSIVYNANAGFVGVDTIRYELSDGSLKDTALLIIVITDPNNVVPVANTDMAATVPNAAIFIDVQNNDVDGNGDNLTTSIVSAPNALNTATVQNGDSILYTPSMSFAGFDTLMYQVCDVSLTCDTAMVVIEVSNTLQISAKVFLEGPFDSGLAMMHDSLRKLNLLPTTEPYSTLPNLAGAYEFEHKHRGGNEVVTNPTTVFAVTGPDAIVDWVYLELLTATDTMPIASRAALIQRDGDIVDVDGTSAVGFEYLPDANYFLSIRHRNHLGVMTKDAEALSSGAFTTLDFTQQGVGGTDAFGTHAMDTIQTQLVLWGGDGNADRKIIYDGIANDRDPVFFDVITDALNINSNYNHIAKGYYRGDYDMKGSSVYIGTGNDPDVIFFNVLLHPSNASGSTIFIIREQIPR